MGQRGIMKLDTRVAPLSARLRSTATNRDQIGAHFKGEETMQDSERAVQDHCQIALAALDRIPAMVAYWNAEQICLYANNAYRDWFGKSPDQIIGSSMAELLGPLYALNLPYIRAALAGEEQIFERTISTPQGGIRYSLATYTPDVSDGCVRGIFVHVADVSPLKALEQELQAAKARAERLATCDPLTGLPNRSRLEPSIAQAIGVAKDQDMIAVLSLDLNGFKQINDTYGHVAGDQVLQVVATRLQCAVRESDTVLRLGGDEFIVVTLGVKSRRSVQCLAERILAMVSQPVCCGTQWVQPGSSIGIALYPEDSTCPAELLRKSDVAMYGVKKLGRQGYAFAGSEHEEPWADSEDNPP